MPVLSPAERESIRVMRVVERRSIEHISRILKHRNRVIAQVLLDLGLHSKPIRRPSSRKKTFAQWTEEARERAAPIVALIERGYSWARAAEALGLSKNAVAGQMWRAGYCEPRGAEPPPRISDIVARIPVTGCHYIEGDPRDLCPDMRCGKPVAAHGLCAEHAALCWVKPAPKVNLGPAQEAA